jgi:folate-dependent tRNA-U54 methylase TrmFO/GidA
MNANFGLLDPLDEPLRGKQQRRREYASRALRELQGWIDSLSSAPATAGR